MRVSASMAENASTGGDGALDRQTGEHRSRGGAGSRAVTIEPFDDRPHGESRPVGRCPETRMGAACGTSVHRAPESDLIAEIVIDAQLSNPRRSSTPRRRCSRRFSPYVYTCS